MEIQDMFDCLKFKDLTDQQIKAYITVYCIENDILVDTDKWCQMIDYVWEHYYCGGIDEKDLFDFYMGDDLC